GPCGTGDGPVRGRPGAGGVRGAALIARWKVPPSAASRSRCGVCARRSPYAPTWSARVVSSVTRSTFGGAPRFARTATRIAISASAAVAIPQPLGIARPPRHLRHDAGKIRPAQHVVERGESAGHDVPDLALRPLTAILELL